MCGVIVAAAGCSHTPSDEGYVVNASEFSPDFQKPTVVGRIESEDVRESSGIAASLCQPDVFWTHNDSGDDAFIVAMDKSGKHLGTWRVTNARNDDWEDIASYKSQDGSCYLYIGDIGNNKMDRARLDVYRVKEPTIASGEASSNRKAPLQTDPADVAVFKYADTPHNAETLLVQPKNGDVYVLTKRLDGPSLVFRFTPQFGSGQVQTAEKVGELSLPAVPNGLLTGGAISQDGQFVILCDYAAGYELRDSTPNFDDIWKTKPIPVDLGPRKHGEAITFAPDGSSIIGTNEGKNAQIFEVKRR
jgi:hypothetical protein